jgi:phage antirepressor protein
MNKLINVTLNDNHEPIVSGRQLHEALDVKTKYADWFNRMIDYGFAENQDFLLLKNEQQTGRGGHNKVDHIIKLDMAKEIAMIQRTERGKSNIKTLQEVKIEADRPKVLFAEAVSASHSSILVGELAKLLKQNGVDMGANRLFNWLRAHGYLIKRNGRDWNMPTQKSVEMGLIRVKETSITHADGHITVSKTPLVTGKGQQYFINKFLNQERLTS